MGQRSRLRCPERRNTKRSAIHSVRSLRLKDSYMASAAFMRIQLENMLEKVQQGSTRASSRTQISEQEPSRSHSSSLNASAPRFVMPTLTSNTSSDDDSKSSMKYQSTSEEHSIRRKTRSVRSKKRRAKHCMQSKSPCKLSENTDPDVLCHRGRCRELLADA